MDRFDTDLWNFLKGKTEKLLGIYERLDLAQKFMEKFMEFNLRSEVALANSLRHF